jgi:hypothetical protein
MYSRRAPTGAPSKPRRRADGGDAAPIYYEAPGLLGNKADKKEAKKEAKRVAEEAKRVAEEAKRVAEEAKRAAVEVEAIIVADTLAFFEKLRKKTFIVWTRHQRDPLYLSLMPSIMGPSITDYLPHLPYKVALTEKKTNHVVYLLTNLTVPAAPGVYWTLANGPQKTVMTKQKTPVDHHYRPRETGKEILAYSLIYEDTPAAYKVDTAKEYQKQPRFVVNDQQVNFVPMSESANKAVRTYERMLAPAFTRVQDERALEHILPGIDATINDVNAQIQTAKDNFTTVPYRGSGLDVDPGLGFETGVFAEYMWNKIIGSQNNTKTEGMIGFVYRNSDPGAFYIPYVSKDDNGNIFKRVLEVPYRSISGEKYRPDIIYMRIDGSDGPRVFKASMVTQVSHQALANGNLINHASIKPYTGYGEDE